MTMSYIFSSNISNTMGILPSIGAT